MVAPSSASLRDGGLTAGAAMQPAAAAAVTDAAATASAEPVCVVVRVRPEPADASDQQEQEEQEPLCVFAEEETRVSIVSASKDHMSRTVASAARQQQQRRLQQPQQQKEQQQQTQARSFSLDRVFGPFASQRDVYEEAARPLIRSVVEG